QALAAFDKVLSLRPNSENAWVGRGDIFYALKRYDEASAAYDKALSIKPDLASAWLGRGNIDFGLKRYSEAFAAYDQALSIKPDLESAEGARLHAKMHLCSWENLSDEVSKLIDSVRAGEATSPPFSLLSLTGSQDDHLRCAQTWVAKRHPQA